MTLVHYLKSQKIMNFAIMGQVEDDCLLGIPRGALLTPQRLFTAYRKRQDEMGHTLKACTEEGGWAVIQLKFKEVTRTVANANQRL